MSPLPAGTVTFLFTDIEGSTRLLQQVGDRRYAQIQADHQRLLQEAVGAAGQQVDTQGDAFFIAFRSAKEAVASAIRAQQALDAHPWPDGTPLRVRMGVHTGEPVHGAVGYVGLGVNRAARICSAAHGGQILLSHTTADLIESDLPDGVHLRDLGEHRLKDLARPERLYQVLAADLPSDFPPLRSLDRMPHNLPVQLTSFVGREREMAEVGRLLTTARLLTLTGVGGSGKTRLVLQVGAELLEDFPDGVWLVELSALADPTLVAQTVALALGLREGRDDAGSLAPLDRLITYLRPKHLLLILDNCEHLLSECARLAHALLRACPGLRIIASSREGLGVEGELTYHVPSLSTPAAGQVHTIESLSQYEAVRLFLERAVLSQPHFVLTVQNAAPVVQICQRLDGIPLAIELAAGRMKALSVEEINARLHERFRLLTGGSRTALPRQRTLHAAMDWSYNLLSENEQQLLRRLAVFAGGWALDAAEAVCAGDGIRKAEVLDLLARLVDKSLVVAEEQEGRTRYLMLETVRQYSQEKLLESGEETALRRRHLDWYLSLAEIRGSGIRKEPWPQTEDRTVLQQFETEHANFRAALDWSLGSGEAELVLRLASALWDFWWLRGHRVEGAAWFGKALSAKAVAPEIRARALWRAAELTTSGAEALAWAEESLDLSRKLGLKADMAYSLWILAGRDIAPAEITLAESLALFRETGQKPGMALAIGSLGLIAMLRGDYEKAAALQNESLALWRDLGNKSGMGDALLKAAFVAKFRGDLKQAKQFAIECLALGRELEDKPSIAPALRVLGWTALAEGDIKQAIALHEESVHMCREMGNIRGAARGLAMLADVAAAQEDYTKATSLLVESLSVSGDVDRLGMLHKAYVIMALRRLGEVHSARGHLRRAARLFGAAGALRDALGIVIPRFQRADYDRAVAATRAGLGEECFAEAWAEGRAMPVEQAVEYALSEGDRY